MTSLNAAVRLTLRACENISIRSMLKTWHRTAGLFAALFLIVLTLTGLLLMQTDDLGLDKRHISHSGLLDWYGIRPAPPPHAFKEGEHWFSQVGSRLFFDHSELEQTQGALVGVVKEGEEFVVATSNSLLLVTSDGLLAEKLDSLVLGSAPISDIGRTTSGDVVVQQGGALHRYNGDAGTLEPLAQTNSVIVWREATSLPKNLASILTQNYRGQGLSLERVIIDLHTGRLFGSLGVALVNIASTLLLLLVVTGFILWLKRPRTNGRNESSSG